MDNFDLVIIGGGPAGYLAGERASEARLSACVIERRALGGVCLNEGCIPTKTFLNSAKMYDHAKNGQRFGVTAENAAIDHGKVVDRKNTVVRQLVAGVEAGLTKRGVEIVRETGKVAGRQGEWFLVRAGGRLLRGRHLLVCAGAQAAVPPIPGVKEGLERGFVLTSRELLDVREAPRRLCVIGGGVIGLEMAAYFAMLGTQVTVIEMLGKIAGETDDEISALLQKNLQKKGVRFQLNCRVKEIGQDSVIYEDNGEEKAAGCDMVLLSVGRKPAAEGLGLDSIGVLCERGAVLTDSHMQTNIPGVYAAGDVTGGIMLAHVAYREAEVAVSNICGKEDEMDVSAIPAVIYTSPEAASCGQTLAGALKNGIRAREVTVSMRYSGRYLAETAGGDGICKLIFDDDKHTLIGAHMLGSYVSEIIYSAVLMIGQKLTVEQIKKTVFPHPTVCEVIREAIFSE